jgi:hypothetical protein
MSSPYFLLLPESLRLDAALASADDVSAMRLTHPVLYSCLLSTLVMSAAVASAAAI